MSSHKTNPVPWLVWSDSNNEVIVSGELNDQSELSTLSRYAQGRAVTVIGNNADIRLLTHWMAIKPSRQMLKALPYMLEDELAEDIDKLHFAIEGSGFDKTKDQHFVNVAIVNKATLQEWIDTLREVEINVSHVLPEVLCLPQQEEGHCSLVELAGGYIIREGNWQGCFIEKDWLPLYVQQHQNKTIHYYTDLPESLKDLNDNVELVAEDPELPMLMLAQSALKQKWNFLQGAFAPKKQVSKSWQIWRPVAVIAGLLFVIQLIMGVAEWQQKETRLAQAKAELAESYKAAFPNEKLRINLLKRQLKSKVAALKGDTGSVKVGYLELMNKMTPVFAEFSAVKVDNLRFDGKRSELRLNAIAPSFQDFEKFRVAISNLGLTVKPGAVNNEGDVVTGSLSIQESS